MGVTGGAGVAATVESGGAPAAHCFCSPVQNVQPRQFLAVFFVFFLSPTRPTNCVNRRSNSGGWRSQRRSADSSDSARRWVRATPPSKSTCSARWWSAGWVIWLVTGRYLALHQPPSKSLTARRAVSAPVHRPPCSGVITGGLLMGGLSSSSQGSVSFLAGLIAIRVSDRRLTTKQVCC